MRTVFASELGKARIAALEALGKATALCTAAPLDAVARQLEQEVYQSVAGDGTTGTLGTLGELSGETRTAYAARSRRVAGVLSDQASYFPDDIVVLLLFAGQWTVADVVRRAATPTTEDADAPRSVTRRMFARTLVAADPKWRGDRELTIQTATQIEVSCFNATVRLSKASEEPPLRLWDSSAFVDIYSTRCGTINGLLNPGSSACVAYGSCLVPRLLSGELQPAALGDMSEKDLCPRATEAERAEIANRSRQKIEEKESNLFRCPHCHERRSTYTEVQRRSLDEAPDYQCRCLNPACRRRFVGRS